MAKIEYEIISGTTAQIKATLENYESTKDPHSLRVLGMTTTDGVTFYVLVRFR